MEVKVIVADLLVFLLGLTLLIFNKQIGKFADIFSFGLRVLEWPSWILRMSVILVGSFFVLIALLGLIDQITPNR